MSSFREFAASAKCPALIPPRELFTCEENSSLTFVLEHLKRLGVHSLPLLNSETKAVEGMVDVLDIVCSVYDISELERFNKGGNFNAGDVASAFIDTSHLSVELGKATAGQLINKAAPAKGELIRDQPAHFGGPVEPTAHVSLDDSLIEVIEKLGKDKRHRVPVITGSGSTDFHNVITQSDCLQFLHANLSTIPETTRKTTLGEMGTKSLVKLHTTAAIAEALFLFRVKRVHSLVVEDRHGKFVGQLTAHNFVSCANNLDVYGLAVDEFFKVSGEPYNELFPSTMTLEEGIKVLCEGRKGRLWVGADHVVERVVSIRDILCEVMKAMA